MKSKLKRVVSCGLLFAILMDSAPTKFGSVEAQSARSGLSGAAGIFVQQAVAPTPLSARRSVLEPIRTFNGAAAPFEYPELTSGVIHRGTKTRQTYNLRLLPPTGDDQKIEFQMEGLGPAGWLLFHEDPAWPAITILDAYVNPEHRHAGLYSRAVQEVVKNTPALTRVRHKLTEPESLLKLFDALPEKDQMDIVLSKDERDALATNDLKRISNALLFAVEQPRTRKDDSPWIYRMSKLNAKLGQTRSGAALLSAGVSALTVVNRGYELWLEGIAGIGKFWNEHEFDELTTDVPINPEAKENIQRLLVAFLSQYIDTFQMPPPAALVAHAYLLLSRRYIDIEELSAFLVSITREDLVALILGQHLEDPRRHLQNFHSYLEKSDMISVLHAGHGLDLGAFPILQKTFYEQSYDAQYAIAVEELRSFAESLQSNHSPNWDQFPTIKNLASTDPLFQANLGRFIMNPEPILQLASMHASELLRPIYKQLSPIKPQPISFSKNQAYWARGLVQQSEMKEFEPLDFLLELRRRQRDATRIVGKNHLSQGRAKTEEELRGEARQARTQELFLYVNEIVNRHYAQFLRDPAMVLRLVGLFAATISEVKEDQQNFDLDFYRTLVALVRQEDLFTSLNSHIWVEPDEEFSKSIRRSYKNTTPDHMEVLLLMKEFMRNALAAKGDPRSGSESPGIRDLSGSA